MLKKVFPILSLIFFSVVLMGQTEFPSETTDYSNDNTFILTWTPTSVLFGKATFGVEYLFASNISAKLNGGFVYANAAYANSIGPAMADFPEVGINVDNADILGFRGYDITPEIRFYLSNKKDAPEGFYLAPFVRYYSYAWTTPNNHSVFRSRSNIVTAGIWQLKYSAPNVGMKIGGQNIWDNGFVFGWHLGLGLGIASIKISAKEVDNYTEADYALLEEDLNAIFGGEAARPPISGSSNQQAFTSSRVPLPVLPFGLSLGYRF